MVQYNEYMPLELLHSINEWVLFFFGLAVLIVTCELFFRLGRRGEGRIAEPSRGRFDVLLAALMTLVALLLGFAVSMAESRYDTRRKLVVQEGNAISNAYQYAAFLPEADAKVVRPLLIQYLDERIAFYDRPTNASFPEFDASAHRIQNDLELYAEGAMTKVRWPIGVGLYAQAVSAVSDVHELRIAAGQNHVPVSVLVLLGVLDAIAVAMMGFTSGLAGRRNLLATTLTIFALWSVVLVSIDLDRPTTGIVKVSQSALRRTRAQLSDAAPSRKGASPSASASGSPTIDQGE
jgi:hypothetical protein